MNLRVDLILPGEQRSASVVNLKSMLRISSIVVPVLIAVGIAAVLVDLWKLKSEVNALEERMTLTEPKLKASAELKEQLARNREILAELDGWRNSRMNWEDHLLALQQGIAKNIQLNTVHVSHATPLIDEIVPARVYTLRLRGKAVGSGAGEAVENLKGLLRERKPFATTVDEALVKRYEELPPDDTTAGKDDRIFEIECKFKPRKFE